MTGSMCEGPQQPNKPWQVRQGFVFLRPCLYLLHVFVEDFKTGIIKCINLWWCSVKDLVCTKTNANDQSSCKCVFSEGKSLLSLCSVKDLTCTEAKSNDKSTCNFVMSEGLLLIRAKVTLWLFIQQRYAWFCKLTSSASYKKPICCNKLELNMYRSESGANADGTSESMQILDSHFGNELAFHTAGPEDAKIVIDTLTEGQTFDHGPVCANEDIGYIFVQSNCTTAADISITFQQSTYTGPVCLNLGGHHLNGIPHLLLSTE